MALVLFGGCARFDFPDAVERIAFARGCETRQVTLLEDRRGTYEESGCGAAMVYECRSGRCSPTEHQRESGEPSSVVTRARAHLEALRQPVLECTDGDGADVQIRFDRGGHPAEIHVRAQSQEQADCVRALVRSVEIDPGERLLLAWSTPG
ncbi:MAG: hypothetical protein H6719_38670 [Sandaracinaceae bacterium]|nr:hypothetical protein [Sandaracinaceae bacterium]